MHDTEYGFGSGCHEVFTLSIVAEPACGYRVPGYQVVRSKGGLKVQASYYSVRLITR